MTTIALTGNDKLVHVAASVSTSSTPTKATVWIQDLGGGQVEPEHEMIERVFQQRQKQQQEQQQIQPQSSIMTTAATTTRTDELREENNEANDTIIDDNNNNNNTEDTHVVVVDVRRFTLKQLQRNHIPFHDAYLVVGDHDVMKFILKRRYKEIQQQQQKHGSLSSHPQQHYDCYPNSLRPFLKRRIMKTTVGSLCSSMNMIPSPLPMFIKPCTDTKQFMGCVVRTQNGLQEFVSRFSTTTAKKKTKRMTVYVSYDIVEWISEWRVFVSHRQHIVGIQHYRGDPSFRLDMTVVTNAIMTLKESSDMECTAGYALDFGVLKPSSQLSSSSSYTTTESIHEVSSMSLNSSSSSSPTSERQQQQQQNGGETTLVEWNDGYALGSYGLDGDIYAELLRSRWREIMVGR